MKDWPADPEGERSAQHLCGEDAENSWEEPEDERGSGLEEDGVGQAERQGKGVEPNVSRDGPHPQSIRPIAQHLHRPVFVPPVPLTQLSHNPHNRHKHRYLPPSPATSTASHFFLFLSPSPNFDQVLTKGSNAVCRCLGLCYFLWPFLGGSVSIM